MRIDKLLLCIILSGLLLASCSEDKRYIYEVDQVEIEPTSLSKTREKTYEQYVSILYANLFQEALPADKMVDITDVVRSKGDKELIFEQLISNFMNKSNVILPTKTEMDADLDTFVEDVYVRFLVRKPTEAEKTWFKNYLLSNPQLTPEMVYFSFALSNEYKFY